MTKEDVANEYLEQCRRHYGDLKIRPDLRKAFVLGANSMTSNIGYAIVDMLLESAGFETVSYYHKTDMPPIPNNLIPEMEQCDVLVLANGSNHLDWIEDWSSEEIFSVVNDCLIESMRTTSAFVDATIDQPWLKYIVYIGSMGGRSVLNGSAPYCAAKAGLIHFARCMGWELTPKGYRVLCINPSNVEGTPMSEATIRGLMAYRELDRQQAEAYWGAINLMPRWLDKEDIAHIVTDFVYSESKSFLSGTSLDLTGGQR